VSQENPQNDSFNHQPNKEPSQSQSATTAESSVTIDALNKFKDTIKQEFMAMIQKEVQKQIQTQLQAMQALQTKAGQLTAKIDGMQEGIKERLAATVRNSIMSVMQSQTPTGTLAQSENAQDGACLMSTGTESQSAPQRHHLQRSPPLCHPKRCHATETIKHSTMPGAPTLPNNLPPMTHLLQSTPRTFLSLPTCHGDRTHMLTSRMMTSA
jgi:hypothetical protein